MADAQRGPAGTWQYLAFWRGGTIDLAATLAGLPVSDLDAALLIAQERDGGLHCAVTSGTWYIWDGRCHAPDSSGRAGRLIAGYALRLEQVIKYCKEEVHRRELARGTLNGLDEPAVRRAQAAAWEPWDGPRKYAAGLRRTAGHSALLKMLAVICGTSDEEMEERHPGRLNFTNGTADLRTGAIVPHDRADMITYCLPCAYDPGAECPQFLRLASRMCGGDNDVMWYLVKVLGYCLLGANPEQLLFFIAGPTGSGKSVLLQICGRLLGPLAHESQAALITLVRHGRNARTENSIRGARLVTITETSAFMTIDEGQVKRITGEARVSVDQHYAKREIKTPVTWTIVLATNQMPVLTDYDDAMRRRIVVIPGGPEIPAAERDKHIAARVAEQEAEGILALLVRACAEYHRSGLAMPLAVQMRTDAYRAQQNTVANFLADCCVIAPAGHIMARDAWEQYQVWARGSSRLGRNEFYEHLACQPGVFRNESTRRFEGVAWSAAALDRMPPGTVYR